ncbi:FG-GAP-like repeat-containing protein [Lentzea sp. NPDC004782]|uniref:FG-GAP-like repeat-containing protein n=1 Tax=Lentzea sp. NPDC004782 TaxID=3154458 RepID=UPI0033A53E25
MLTLRSSRLVGASAVAIALIGASAVSANAEPIAVRAVSGAIPGSYVVVLKDNTITASAALAGRYGGTVTATWQHALHGFAARMSAAQAARLAKDPAVSYVQQDGEVHLTDSQQSPPSWGLDRVDQRQNARDSRYTFESRAANVRAYVIDTGIRTSHATFGGRAAWGTNTTGDNNNTDCNGHGTHVAGTIGGAEYGIAKNVNLVAVKVLNCSGSGSWTGVISGIDWVTANAVRPAVANMSLGGGANAAVDQAVRNSIASGVTYAIASGNSNADACNFSPARVTEALTVNNSDVNDRRASSSDFGSCTDLFAPGTGITSAWNTSDTASNTISGTSMATPHVAGAAALWLANHPYDTPPLVANALLTNATPNAITDPAGSPNLLLYAPVSDGVTDTKADYNADGRGDIALNGVPGWGSIPTAFSNGNGAFGVTNAGVPDFATWSSTPGVKLLTGDFNGDGRTDIALTGPSGWGSIPVAFSNGDGTYTITNAGVPDFPVWATTPGVKIVTGDFNGDGRTDIALAGGAGWGSVPVAFSNGNGTFSVTNAGVGDFATWANTPSVKLVAGDVNGDGRTDIALTGVPGWGSIPVAFANGDGSFSITNAGVGSFPGWAATPNVKVLTGDFNGDRRMDFALTGVQGWGSIPVAFSNGDGSFSVTNAGVADFPAWATTAGVRIVAKDFNGDGRTDIALTGGLGWGSIPVAFSNGNGTFGVTNAGVADFPTWANSPGVELVARDFNGDGRTDLALTGVAGWGSIPVAFSNGNGTFGVTNAGVADFPTWAATPAASIL